MRKLKKSAQDFMPRERSLDSLRAASKGCQGCDLYLRGTQTVFGEGSPQAKVIFVGEQPGDKEDLAGRPFVGPAGKLLANALEKVGIDRDEIYITNAVKHFKWEPRGKRRIHKKPSALQIAACRPWLDAEIEAIQPEVVVCLGATAAQALLGSAFRVTQRRGELIPLENGRLALATVHPSSILRAIDEESRHEEMALFVDDLQKLANHLKRARKDLRRTA